jgi:hypothetical protein
MPGRRLVQPPDMDEDVLGCSPLVELGPPHLCCCTHSWSAAAVFLLLAGRLLALWLKAHPHRNHGFRERVEQPPQGLQQGWPHLVSGGTSTCRALEWWRLRQQSSTACQGVSAMCREPFLFLGALESVVDHHHAPSPAAPSTCSRVCGNGGGIIRKYGLNSELHG